MWGYEMELIRITTYIGEEQYKNIQEHSYKGKKKDQKENELTFSEHLRKAIEEYERGLNK